MAEEKREEITKNVGEWIEKMDPDEVKTYEAALLAYLIGKEAGKKERSKND